MRKKIIKKEYGQSLVESALVIPLIFLLIFTFIDLGRAVYYYSALSNGVREGARFASVTPLDLNLQGDKDQVEAKVSGYSVSVEISTFDALKGTDTVTVTATSEFYPITPFLARMLGSGNTISLTAESTMMLAPIAR